jgi:hypothetical protein
LLDGARALRKRLLRHRPASSVSTATHLDLLQVASLGGRRPHGALRVFVMPSTSPRGASYSRAEKLAYFRQLVRLRDELRRQAVAS